MPLDKETLNLASQKKYTDFSNAVKHELKSKLSKHKKAKEYVSDFDKIAKMKDSFAAITKSKDEPKEEEIPKQEEIPKEEEIPTEEPQV